MLGFVDLVVQQIGVGDDFNRFAVATFSTYTDIKVHLRDFRGDELGLSYDILTIRYAPGQTNTGAAINIVREQIFTFQNGDRPDAPDIVLLITDGISNINKGLTEKEAAKSRKAGLNFFTVGIGLQSDRELKQIVDNDYKKVFLVDDFTELNAIANDISTKICNGKFSIFKKLSHIKSF